MSGGIETLRGDARRCIDAALAAVEPGALVRAALDRHRRFTTARANGIAVLAAGKAADAMAAAALTRLRGTAAFALVVAPETPGDAAKPIARARGGVPLRRLTAPHPTPGPASVSAARMTVAWLDALPPATRLLVLLSGGASALLTLPLPGLDVADIAATSDALLRAGAGIDAVNAVRKRLDGVKGGRLAERVTGRDVLVLAISDVVGDRLDLIGSGPFHPDSSSWADASDAIDAAGIRDFIPAAVYEVLAAGARGERPGTPPPGAATFARVTHDVISSGTTARDAAVAAAAELGYDATAMVSPLVGEARDAAGTLLHEAGVVNAGSIGTADSRAARDRAFVAYGETTVTVRGPGHGGRSQELALAAAILLDGATGIVLAAAGTDGVDGPTDAAGAIVDGGSAARMRGAGVDPNAALELNDSYAAHAASGDLLRTGATGTNVGDVQIVLRSGSGAAVADAE